MSGTETTSTTSSDPTGMDTQTETFGFVPDTNPTDLSCDPWAQDCPEGEKCVPYVSSDGGLWDAHKCVPVMGEQAPGESCESAGPVEATDDCDITSFCWNVDNEGVGGECVRFCSGTPDAPICPSASQCLIDGNGVFNLCIGICDPLIQDCGAGQACYWDGGSFSCAPTTQDIPAGQPCGFVNDCALGLICVGASAVPDCAGANCCTAYCDLEQGDAGCAALPGTSCVPFFEEGQEPPSNPTLGVCQVP